MLKATANFPSRKSASKRLWTMLAGLAALLFVLTAGFLCHVSKELTSTDKQAIGIFLAHHGIQPASPRDEFGKQLEFISSVQMSIIAKVPQGQGLPEGRTREPSDVLSASEALCYDRSRFIEKTLMWAGFRTRHAFLFKADNGVKTTWLTLLSRHLTSHAVSEVMTSKGWLIVGSNLGFLSIESTGRIWSMRELQESENLDHVAWLKPVKGKEAAFWNSHFKKIYGLYSRHGYFYPPFVPFPDINLGELLENLPGAT